MTTDIELPAAPWLGYDAERGDLHGFSHDEVRSILTQAIAAKDVEIEALRAKTAVTMGVGSGGGKLFVHGDYESIKAAQEIVLRAERLAEALRVAEAALADIGDADRDPGDDVAWCERRASEPLPMIRALLRDREERK